MVRLLFHFSRVLTDTGVSFNYYLHFFGRSDTDTCSQCGHSSDNVEHAIFQTATWSDWKYEACFYLGLGEIIPNNVVNVMLPFTDSSRRRVNLVKTREAKERIRELLRQPKP